MLSNAWQMTAQYSKSREITELGTFSWLYTPFKDLPKEKEEEMLQKIQSNVKLQNHESVVSFTLCFIKMCIVYYERKTLCVIFNLRVNARVTLMAYHISHLQHTLIDQFPIF